MVVKRNFCVMTAYSDNRFEGTVYPCKGGRNGVRGFHCGNHVFYNCMECCAVYSGN